MRADEKHPLDGQVDAGRRQIQEDPDADEGRQRFNRLSTYLKAQYGERIYKVSLRGGFTCPNRDGTLGWNGCAFCAGEALEPTGYRRGQTIEQQLACGLSYLEKRHGARRVIAYYQDYSATYATGDRLHRIYAPALAHPNVVCLAVGTRPDCLSDEALEQLRDVAARKDMWVELGLQIADDRLLEGLGRGHGVASFESALLRLDRAGIRVCVHVIIGLPGSSSALEQQTAAWLATLPIWGIKLHAFHVLKGTPLAKEHLYQPLPLLEREQHAQRVVDVLERLPSEVVVHRITGEAPRRLTLAPEWTINKMACFDAVVAAFVERDTWQGRRYGWQAAGIQ